MDGTFDPVYSTNNIYYDENMSKCLTVRVEEIQSDIADLNTSKANVFHQHAEYASTNHNHSYNNLNDLPTSLPANGGNADTVDGKHANDFATSTHTHTAAEVGALPVTTVIPSIDGLASEAYVSNLLSEKANSSHTHESNDIILTDTVTGVKYKLFMTNGKLTAVEQN